jgi:hypothetical protein
MRCRCVAQIQVRLANARTEMAKRDVPGFFDGIVMNDTLEAGFERLKGALLLRCGLDAPLLTLDAPRSLHLRAHHQAAVSAACSAAP